MDQKILVYEPNSVCRNLLSFYIKKENLHPILAHSHYDFVELAKQECYVAIIVDCRLLLEMPGNLPSGTYLIGTTADFRFLKSSVKKDFGLNELLLKPIERRQYLQTIQNVTGNAKK